jgi:hypothetical protein
LEVGENGAELTRTEIQDFARRYALARREQDRLDQILDERHRVHLIRLLAPAHVFRNRTSYPTVVRSKREGLRLK